ncbi:S8 family peptidase [Brevibacillus massiliensis]|uniref:S8 family peptidase n=1 Tax=Brevibacillus massiliensis TaxID=1118054 RepID=UPI0002EC1AE8|nr:S8 family serine peptidase [Brevibacillus massiliensis]
MNKYLAVQRVAALVIGICILASGQTVAWAAVEPNDSYYKNQSYLTQIGANNAWSTVKGNTDIKIAVLDSGVDTNHPDLAPNLLPGVNLEKPERQMQDDYGHGTQVMGILAAKGNNKIGVTGVMWDAHVIPIKVLDKNGRADVKLLAKGINQAVAMGAKVVLMSVSNLYNSPLLEQAVKNAEAKGVVLVAAAGNEGSRVGYPAAYPTVIAVGAVDRKNTLLPQSNIGPEINLVAPGSNIYTTRVGGGYGPISGTSAAAPQVAAAAALVLARNPKMTPLEVRQLLYYTATDLGPKGWDKKYGYGLLNVGRAVKTKLPADINEPNNTQATAAAFPIESQVRGQLSSGDPIDWFYSDIPYDGKLVFTTKVTPSSGSAIAATFYRNGDTPVTYYVGGGKTLTVPVRAGKLYFKLERGSGAGTFSYVFESKFMINPDKYEPNDDQKTARPLPPGNHITIVGNFDQPGDLDWFSYYVREQGKLNITVSVDTKRIDPVVYVVKQGRPDQKFDNGTAADPTERVSMEVSPGKYYFRVSDYWNNAVNGEYVFDLSYLPERRDYNEPNDTPQLAAKLGSGTLMTGTLPSKNDQDWFQFDVATDSLVTIDAPQVPVPWGLHMVLYDEKLKTIISVPDVAEQAAKGGHITQLKLKKGTYYIILTSTNPFKYDTYRLTVDRKPTGK